MVADAHRLLPSARDVGRRLRCASRALQCGRMRLKSEIWVKAYLRRCQVEGAAAVLVRRGDTDAGAIYIKVSRLDGTAALFGPAPAGLEEAREDRRWQPCLGRQSAAAAPTSEA